MTKEAEWVSICSSIKEYIVYNAENKFGSISFLSAIRVETVVWNNLWLV